MRASSVEDGCDDDWGMAVCRTASAHSVASLELASQRNELLRIKEFDKFAYEHRLTSGAHAFYCFTSGTHRGTVISGSCGHIGFLV